MPLALAGALLSACTVPLLVATPLDILDEFENAVSRAEWLETPLHAAWIYPPGARMLLMRSHGRVAEQRIALANSTSLPGDNFIFMRSIPRSSPGVIRLRQVIGQSGELPEPFTDDDLEVMRTTEDSVGALSWAEWSSGAGTTCVLALRRLTVEARVLPPGASAIDLLLRNCVRGTADDALKPAGADLVALPASAQLTHGAGQRPLSPLAAPEP